MSSKAFAALLGCGLNAALIYITYKQKNLHGICNIFIGFNAFFNLLYETGYNVWPVLLASGVRVIKIYICFISNFYLL
uniref:Uncharacterized protein n=1 Tax=Ditylenchus dipsaci TaxID=166011 RepID=A0A915EBR0_9BILA